MRCPVRPKHALALSLAVSLTSCAADDLVRECRALDTANAQLSRESAGLGLGLEDHRTRLKAQLVFAETLASGGGGSTLTPWASRYVEAQRGLAEPYALMSYNMTRLTVACRGFASCPIDELRAALYPATATVGQAALALRGVAVVAGLRELELLSAATATTARAMPPGLAKLTAAHHDLWGAVTALQSRCTTLPRRP